MTMRKRLARYFHCPTEFTLAVLDGKWKTVILSYLKERPCRYSELRRLVPSLSDKMLSERLRDLTSAGLVVRRPVGISRLAQRYALTEKASSLSAVLQQLYAWGKRARPIFGRSFQPRRCNFRRLFASNSPVSHPTRRAKSLFTQSRPNSVIGRRQLSTLCRNSTLPEAVIPMGKSGNLFLGRDARKHA